MRGVALLSCAVAVPWCALPFAIQQFVDQGIRASISESGGGILQATLKPLAKILFLVSVVFVFDMWRYLWSARLGRDVSKASGTRLVDTALGVPLTAKIEINDVVQRGVADRERVEKWWEAQWGAITFNCAVLLGATAAIAVYSPVLAGLAAGLVFAGTWLQKTQSKRLETGIEEYHRRNRDLHQDIRSLVSGKVSWLPDGTGYVRGRVVQTIAGVGVLREQLARRSYLSNETGMVGRLLIQCALLFGALVLLNHNLTIGKFVALGEFFSMISGASSTMWIIFPEWKHFCSAAKRLESGLTVDHVPKRGETAGLEAEISKGDGLIQVRGCNGSGKTSMLHHVTQNLKDRTRVVFVPQEPVLFAASMQENIALADRLANGQASRIRLLGLGPVHQTLSKRLNGRNDIHVWSGGERQLVSLLRGFSGEADVYVFDEPFTYLDAVTRQCVSEALQRLSRTKAVVIVEHGNQDSSPTWTRMSFDVHPIRPSPGSAASVKCDNALLNCSVGPSHQACTS